jgi:hypothetical protein
MKLLEMYNVFFTPVLGSNPGLQFKYYKESDKILKGHVGTIKLKICS